jgi:hypothetical protein
MGRHTTGCRGGLPGGRTQEVHTDVPVILRALGSGFTVTPTICHRAIGLHQDRWHPDGSPGYPPEVRQVRSGLEGAVP